MRTSILNEIAHPLTGQNAATFGATFFCLIKSIPLLQIWLLEPYVLFTKGVLKEISTEEDELIELAKRTSNSISSQQNSSISFPALKILYKLFDSDSSKQ